MEIRTQTPATSRLASNPNELLEAIKNRRATDSFTSEPVDDADLTRILEAARQAPSGYNLQPWRIIVLQDEASRKRLQTVAYNQEKISQAPVVLIFLGMKEQTKAWAKEVFAEGNRRGLGKPEKSPEIIQTATAFISNLGWELWLNRHVMIAFSFAMLAAESLDYDTAPMEGFDADAVKREFSIPREAEVIALLAIGHAQEPDKKYPGRLPLEKIVFAETFGQNWQREA